MAFTVQLNGANYVSQNRRKAFEEALRESSDAPVATAPIPSDPVSAAIAPRTEALDDSHGPIPETTSEAPNGHKGPGDYLRILASLERGLSHSYEHQTETLRVHQHYLNNQSAYASIFAQLMQEQAGLFRGGELSAEQARIAAEVLKSLTRSMDRFHQHQAETLTVHGQFLSQQATYAQTFVELLQDHYGGALSGNGSSNGNGHGNGQGNGHSGDNGNGHHTPASSTPSLRQPAAVAVGTQSSEHLVGADSPRTPMRDGASGRAVEDRLAAASRQVVTTRPEVLPAAAGPTGEVLAAALLEIVSDKTGYPAEMLDLDMDMEADLGIDSIKRVEILGALQEQYPELPEVETEDLAELRTLAQIIGYTQAQSGPSIPVAEGDVAAVASPPAAADADSGEGPVAALIDVDALSGELLAIVSDKTGYPAEMLELDMDMEADLGIDSIKRVEILGALQEAHPDLPEIETEDLAELRTLAQILDHIREGTTPKKA
jgi:acyl carrier protein